jgi:hypothetical protein
MKKLFLDDVRTPEMVWRDTIHPLYEDNNTWVIVNHMKLLYHTLMNLVYLILFLSIMTYHLIITKRRISVR